MLNVNRLTAELARMPDQSLQQYAAMHKNDPYTVALALAESNRRKEMRMASQGQGAGQMPKVVDQDIAEMAAPQALPEQVGIGALPAQNIQGMAEGGIVGYAGGGAAEEDKSARNPLAFLNPADMWGAVQRWRASGQPLLPYMGLASTQLDPNVIPKGTSLGPSPSNQEIEQALGMTAPAAGGFKTQSNVPLGGAAPAAPAAAPATGGEGLGTFMQYLKANQPAKPETMEAFLARQRDVVGEAPTKKQLERIEKQEAQALADKEESKTFALLKAGLGMMSGTSPHALVNIGEGAKAGVEQLIQDTKEGKKMALERDKMRDAIESAAYAYKRGDFDAYQKYQNEAANRQASYAAHGLTALGSITGHQISAGATKDYINAIRGGSLIESTRKDIESAVLKELPYGTPAQREALFNKKWSQAVQANPVLAQLSGGATGGGGAVDTSGFKVVGVR